MPISCNFNVLQDIWVGIHVAFSKVHAFNHYIRTFLANKEAVMKRHIIGTFLFFCLGAIIAVPAYPDCDEGVSAYRRGDYAAALQRFTKDGSAQAKFYLSHMYEKGDG